MPDNSDRIGSARRTAELLAPLPAKLAAEGPCPGEVAKKNATRELRGWRNISGGYWDRYWGRCWDRCWARYWSGELSR
jgi:hypothetical protein